MTHVVIYGSQLTNNNYLSLNNFLLYAYAISARKDKAVNAT